MLYAYIIFLKKIKEYHVMGRTAARNCCIYQAPFLIAPCSYIEVAEHNLIYVF
jgi:hypothetical protein